MKRSILAALIVGILCIRPAHPSQLSRVRLVDDEPAPSVVVRFSPNGGCTDALISEINAAQRQVLVQAYEFDSIPIFNALVAARQRGLEVFVIFDKHMGAKERAISQALFRAGCRVGIDKSAGLAHNKVCTIDATLVLTGSFNYTDAAERRNFENLLIISDPDIGFAYAQNFTNEWGRSCNIMHP